MNNFIALIGFTHPHFPTWHGGPHLWEESITASSVEEAQSTAERIAAGRSGELGSPVVKWVKTAARHHHDKAQELANMEPKPARIVPRHKSDELHGDTITIVGKKKIKKTITTTGWLELIRRCRGEMQSARSIVLQVAAGIIPDNLPA
jgi:hypothetical protein